MNVNTVFDIKNFSDKELFAILENNVVPNAPVKALAELIQRLYSVIEEQQKEIDLLKSAYPAKSSKKSGRKRESFYIGKAKLDADYLIYLIDNGYYTFKQLEKELNASKNQLRNRYNRAKKKSEGEK
ncbi:MAG: hypothetical protein ACI4DQ_08850 [Lachnospiraceae bacterium]